MGMEAWTRGKELYQNRRGNRTDHVGHARRVHLVLLDGMTCGPRPSVAGAVTFWKNRLAGRGLPLELGRFTARGPFPFFLFFLFLSFLFCLEICLKLVKLLI
jgi:hypothetical protein